MPVPASQMDATANEHAALQVKGFPTILMFPAGSSDKTPVTFETDRSLKACPPPPLTPNLDASPSWAFSCVRHCQT